MTVDEAQVQHFYTKGLGYGIDATDTTIRSKKWKVECRRVLLDSQEKNYIYGDDSTSTAYAWTKNATTSFNIGVNTVIPTNTPVTVLGDASFSLRHSKFQSAFGDKKITQSLEFTSTPTSSEIKKNSNLQFVNRLNHELFSLIGEPDLKQLDPIMIADQIERNLTSTNEKLFVDKMYEFISYLKITHYISNVSLGGAVYYDFTSTETSRSIGGDLGFGCGPLQERVKLNVERHTGSSYGKCTQIGGMADVSRVEKNNQEGIVEYGLLPLYDLLLKDHTKTRRALSKAIGKYIKEKEKESAPKRYLITSRLTRPKPGGEDVVFVVRVRGSLLEVVEQKKEIEESYSLFYIDGSPESFTIAYEGNNTGFPTQYISRSIRHPSRLRLDETKPVSFCLRPKNQQGGSDFTNVWVNQFLHIKLKGDGPLIKRYLRWGADQVIALESTSPPYYFCLKPEDISFPQAIDISTPAKKDIVSPFTIDISIPDCIEEGDFTLSFKTTPNDADLADVIVCSAHLEPISHPEIEVDKKSKLLIFKAFKVEHTGDYCIMCDDEKIMCFYLNIISKKDTEDNPILVEVHMEP